MRQTQDFLMCKVSQGLFVALSLLLSTLTTCSCCLEVVLIGILSKCLRSLSGACSALAWLLDLESVWEIRTKTGTEERETW